MSELKDSGARREFDTGAVRDIDDAKGRCDLMPLNEVGYMLLETAPANEFNKNVQYILSEINKFVRTGNVDNLYEACAVFIHSIDGDMAGALLAVSKHFRDGAVKYGERNWEKGIPMHSYVDSAVRHLIKYCGGYKDEPHDRAFIWNLLCLAWTANNIPKDNKDIWDLPF